MVSTGEVPDPLIYLPIHSESKLKKIIAKTTIVRMNEIVDAVDRQDESNKREKDTQVLIKMKTIKMKQS